MGVLADAERWAVTVRLETLGANLEAAASLAAMYRLGYNKGYSDCELLKAFCEEPPGEPYFPMADTRPTAERLGWLRSDG